MNAPFRAHHVRAPRTVTDPWLGLFVLASAVSGCRQADPSTPPDPPRRATTPSGLPAHEEVESSERPCGGMDPAAQACPPEESCIYPIEASCGAADQGGVCRKKPKVCGQRSVPVCGCDGRTYPNACVARSERVSLASLGACQAAPGTP